MIRRLVLWMSLATLPASASNVAFRQAETTPACSGADGMMIALEPEPLDSYDIANIAHATGNLQAHWRPALEDLPNEAVLITVKEFGSTGEVQYLTAGATSKNTTYEVTQDYMKFISLCDTRTPSAPRIVRYGVGLRVRAGIVSKKKDVSLGSLLPIGIAASSEDVRGSLSVEVTGIQSRDVTNAIPLPAKLSEESVIGAIQAIATIKARIYDQISAPGAPAGSATVITVQRIAEQRLNSELHEVSPGKFQLNLQALRAEPIH